MMSKDKEIAEIEARIKGYDRKIAILNAIQWGIYGFMLGALTTILIFALSKDVPK